MTMDGVTKKYKYLFKFIALLTALIFFILTGVPDDRLHIIACDVGQGDATLITYKSNEILIDGGPDSKVINCLSKHLPFWDRTIEMVMMTHPQTDHYQGLIDVFKNYQVDLFIADGLDSGNQSYRVLKNLVRSSGARVVNPTTGMALRLDLIYLDIVWPNDTFIKDEFAYISSKRDKNDLGVYTSKLDPNEFSVVAILSFKDFRGIFTGDIGPETEDKILAENLLKPVNYIKVPHHGSKNGLTEDFLKDLTPQVATISVGKHNSYGHPSPEIVDLLSKYNVKTYRTDEIGDVEFISDGEKLNISN